MTHGSASRLAKVVAIARRDLTLEAAYHFRLGLRFVRILFLTTTLYFIAKLVHDPTQLDPYGGQYFEFVVVGFVVTSFVLLSLSAITTTINDEQRAGTLEMLLTSPTSLPVLLAGTFVVPLAFTVLEVTVYVTLAIVLFGANLSVGAILLSTPLLALTVATFASLGIFSAAFVVLTKRGDPVTLFAAQITVLFAGAIFPTTVLPHAVQWVTRLIPAYYGLEGVRRTVLGHAGLVDEFPYIAALAAFAIVLLPLSVWCFARALHVARATGTLGTY
jgi:ABC-2 type transport system permease protein